MLVVVLLGVPAMLLLVALVLDLGLAFAARQQLQSVADNAARAALGEATRSGLASGSRLAQQLARQTSVVNGGVELSSSRDIAWGTYDFAGARFRSGDPPLGLPPQAVRIQARRTVDSLAGPLGGLLRTLEVEAQAVASYRCRDVVLVQDGSGSFVEEFAQAKAGLLDLVAALSQGDPGTTRIGLVLFQGRATRVVDLTPVPQQTQVLTRAIRDLSTCADPTVCGGTNHGHGIHVAAQMLLEQPSQCSADPLIVIVSDGVPCGADGLDVDPPDPETEPFGRVAGALDRAAFARENGISIAPILLAVPGGTACTRRTGPVSSDPGFNAQLAAGFGFPIVISRGNELTDALLRTLGSFPIVLVR